MLAEQLNVIDNITDKHELSWSSAGVQLEKMDVTPAVVAVVGKLKS